MSTRKSERGQETHPEVQKGLGGPPEGSGRVARPTRTSVRGRKDHPEVWEWSGGPLGGLTVSPGQVGRPFWRTSGVGRPT